MKVATATICVNPTSPIKQAGFIQQVSPIFDFHDDLYAHLIAFDDGDNITYHIAIDNLGIPIMIQECLKSYIESKSDKSINVTISATHTHFAPDAKDLGYQNELTKKLIDVIDNLDFKEYANVGISYKCIPFEEVGTSRISNHKANVLLQLFTIYDNHKPLINMIVHNCHPTILNGDTSYFSSEYPGYVLSELKRLYPNTYFTFLQGAAGDVSTRFTRSSQDYSAVVELGNKMVLKVHELINSDEDIKPFEFISYEREVLTLEHEFNPIDINSVDRSSLTKRELDTIEVGMKVRDNLSRNLDTLDKQLIISKLGLGPYSIVFSPNEMFSSYIDCVDTNKCALACYSNGYSPYVTGINDDFITYEKFTDTLTVETKQKYMNILKKFGK